MFRGISGPCPPGPSQVCLPDVDAGDKAGEFGEQRGVREDRRGEKAGGGLACCRVAVVPEVRGDGVGEPGVDVGLDVPARTAGEFVAYGFVPVAGLGLLQRRADRPWSPSSSGWRSDPSSPE
ncbi:hypothetical protein QBA54_38800 [Streptomyces sp. B21-108]|uniref:hypothetical protein n=1 Tax=Streptomyces sp. B21-108 TaxID=3039419 RepID=UPI002FEFCF63